MLAIPELPIPTDAVPERLRRFADPNGPAPARMMAARGMVPVKGGDLVLLLVQLTADSDAGVSQAAYAHALGLQLGGLNRYGGIEKAKPLLNPGGRAADQQGVQAILEVSQRNALLWLAISGLGALLA